MTQLRYKSKKMFNQKFYEFLEKTKDISWDWENMRHNPSLPLQFVINNQNYNWSPSFFNKKYKFKFVSLHSGLDIDLITANPKFDWDWNCILEFTNIDFKDLKKFINESKNSGEFKSYSSPIVKQRRKFDINDMINLDINELDYDYLCMDYLPKKHGEFETYLSHELNLIKKENIISIIRYYENEKHGNIFHMKLLSHDSIYVNFNYVLNLISNKTITENIVKILSKNVFIMEYYIILMDLASRIIQTWFRKKLYSPYTRVGKRYMEYKYNLFKTIIS